MNSVTLQMMNYLATLFYDRTVYCICYYHHHPLGHNAMTSDIVRHVHFLQLPEHSTQLSDFNFLIHMI